MFTGSIIGIDPGVHGSLAIIKNSRVVDLIDTPIEVRSYWEEN